MDTEASPYYIREKLHVVYATGVQKATRGHKCGIHSTAAVLLMHARVLLLHGGFISGLTHTPPYIPYFIVE